MTYPRFSLGEIILYENRLYVINSIYALNWFLENEPFVYGLVTITSNLKEPYAHKELLVREGLLKNITDTDRMIWKVLYG